MLKGTFKENRQQFYRNLVNNSITKNLSHPLSDSTEEDWQAAFSAMELINYKTAWSENKIQGAFGQLTQRSIEFQRSLLEVVYANFESIFLNQVKTFISSVKDSKIFGMCAAYILKNAPGLASTAFLKKQLQERIGANTDDPVLQQLQFEFAPDSLKIPGIRSASVFKKDYLPGNVLMISIQRSNRNYPGLVIIRDAQGNFAEDTAGIFFVPQLAKSISGLPGYLTNGNTPEGIFRMDGFDVSQSSFIGPTPNVQLTMPFEDNPAHYFRDSLLQETGFTIDQYKKLLPPSLADYYPMYQSYYAGKAGRTEVIAHGTTVDPSYYYQQPYYPLTPTLGCLCTEEIWNEETGRLAASDQQKLVDAITKAGGPNGYAIVINISNDLKPVTINEVADLIQKANQ